MAFASTFVGKNVCVVLGEYIKPTSAARQLFHGQFNGDVRCCDIPVSATRAYAVKHHVATDQQLGIQHRLQDGFSELLFPECESKINKNNQTAA